MSGSAPARSSMAVIETRALTKRYDATTALDGLDLSVRAGEVYGFLGPNGAGKTTTIRLLLGLHRATGGGASVFGLDAWAPRVQIHRRLGRRPSSPALWPQMNAAEIFALVAAIAVFACLVGAISAAVSAAALPPGIRHAFARVISGSVITRAGYLGFASLLFVLAVSLFAVAQLAAARCAETDGELDALLALPVSAARWLAGRLLITVIAAVVLSATLAVCLWAGATVAGAQVPLPGLLEAGANCVAVASFHVSAAVLIALIGAAGLFAGPVLLRRRDLGMS